MPKERSDVPPQQLELGLDSGEIVIVRAGRNTRYTVLLRDGVEVTREDR